MSENTKEFIFYLLGSSGLVYMIISKLIEAFGKKSKRIDAINTKLDECISILDKEDKRITELSKTVNSLHDWMNKSNRLFVKTDKTIIHALQTHHINGDGDEAIQAMDDFLMDLVEDKNI